MTQKVHCNWSFLLFFSVVFIVQVQCINSEVSKWKQTNATLISLKSGENKTEEMGEFTKDLVNIFAAARKGGGGGGGGGGIGMGMSGAIMKTIISMCSTTIPMVTMTVMGWMKDIMMMGAGAFMMLMYDMLRKNGDQKKIIIKLPPQAVQPPETAPPAQTGYGPWEGR